MRRVGWLAFIGACVALSAAQAEDQPRRNAAARRPAVRAPSDVSARPVAPRRSSGSRLNDRVSDVGKQARGVYLPGAYVRRHGVKGIRRLMARTNSNAVVIDMKDGTGRVTYNTEIEILKESVVPYMDNPAAVISELKEAGVYTIARVVCFSDPVLPERYPERAIVHVRRGTPWKSWGTNGTWLDPYNRDNHELVIALAREVEAAGFDEIQLDYVRFPVDDGTQYARYPAQDDTPRPQLLLELLRRLDETLAIPIGVDVFGLSAYREGDPSGLGQDLVAWRSHVDVYTPMLYINSMRSWDVGRPDRSRRLVETGVARLRARLGEGPVIRPFLQAFAAGAGHDGFNPRFIARQIRGARRGGADGFLFWHPGARYSMYRAGMQGPARRLSPFPIRGAEGRAQNLPEKAAGPPTKRRTREPAGGDSRRGRRR